MSDQIVRPLVLAIVQLALDDYQYLLSNGLEKATENRYTYNTEEIRRFLCGRDGEAILRSLFDKYRVPASRDGGMSCLEPVSGENLLHAIENRFAII